jgi:hypothetical protein
MRDTLSRSSGNPSSREIGEVTWHECPVCSQCYHLQTQRTGKPQRIPSLAAGRETFLVHERHCQVAQRFLGQKDHIVATLAVLPARLFWHRHGNARG